MAEILIFFHCKSNTGYAIGRHEVTFAQMAYRLVGCYKKVHFGYPEFDNGPSDVLPSEINNYVIFDSSSIDVEQLERIRSYVKKNNIKVAFGFDQPVLQKSYDYLREGGVRKIFSYWGAPMSSIYNPALLPFRKLQYRFKRGGVDHFIFQSEGMRRTATHGVGIPFQRTSVVRSGVDSELFKPNDKQTYYVHDRFGISHDKKIIYYSGHMEERKGVHVIIKAAAHIVNSLGRHDLHFVLLGNKDGQEKKFSKYYSGTSAEKHITFGGYRDDVEKIQPSCTMAVIATTGWDSHTMTAVEVAASGLPLIVSDLPGIREAVSKNTGFRFKAGDFFDLANKIMIVADDSNLQETYGLAARQRVLSGYTRQHQIKGLENIVRKNSDELFV